MTWLCFCCWPTGGAGEPAVGADRGGSGVPPAVVSNPGGAARETSQEVRNVVCLRSQSVSEPCSFCTCNLNFNSRSLCRASTASSRPRRELKPKLVRSSVETLDSHHNGLSYSSSLKPTGTDTSCRLCSTVLSAPLSLISTLSFLTEIQISRTANGKSRSLVYSTDVIKQNIWKFHCYQDTFHTSN